MHKGYSPWTTRQILDRSAACRPVLRPVATASVSIDVQTGNLSRETRESEPPVRRAFGVRGFGDGASRGHARDGMNVCQNRAAERQRPEEKNLGL